LKIQLIENPMEQQAEILKDRTKQFTLGIIRVVRSLPPSPEARIIGHQLQRSGMSVAANYRAVCRARLLLDARLLPEAKLKDLKSEANQLVAIFDASWITAKKRVQSTINNQQSTICAREAS
jgi:four helix bundle protein